MADRIKRSTGFRKNRSTLGGGATPLTRLVYAYAIPADTRRYINYIFYINMTRLTLLTYTCFLLITHYMQNRMCNSDLVNFRTNTISTESQIPRDRVCGKTQVRQRAFMSLENVLILSYFQIFLVFTFFVCDLLTR